MEEIELEFVEGTSSKFWRAKVDGTALTVTYGRIGTAGQTQEKSFDSDTAAKIAYDKQVAEKKKKGYAESGNPSGSVVATVAVKPATKPKAAAATTDDSGEAAGESSDAAAIVKATKKPVAPVVRVNVGETFRRRALVEPLPPAKPKVFREWDAEALAARIEQMGDAKDSRWSWKWGSVDLDTWPSKEEAAFWLSGFNLDNYNETIAKIAKQAREFRPDSNAKTKNASNLLQMAPRLGLRCLFVHTGLAELAKALDSTGDYYRRDALKKLVDGLFLFLDDSERMAFRDALLGLKKNPEPWVLPIVSALNPDPEMVASALSKMKDGDGKPAYFGYSGTNETLQALMGLQNPDDIAREARRLEAYPESVDDIKVLLAATEFRCLDLIEFSVLQMTAKADAERMANALALAEGPDTAPVMLNVLLESKAPHVARTWLDNHPEFAAHGLVPLATAAGKKGDAAVAYLRSMHKRGLTQLIEAQLETAPENVASAIRTKVLIDDEDGAAPLGDDEIPEWLAIVLGGELTVPDAVADENPPRQLRVEMVSGTAKATALPAYTPLPPAPNFDFDAALAKLLPLWEPNTASYGTWNLVKFKPQLPMSVGEARFWLRAVHEIQAAPWNKPIQPADLEKSLRASMGLVASLIGQIKKKDQKSIGAHWVVPVWVESGPDGIFGMAFNDWSGQVTKNFVAQVLPFLDDNARAEMKKKVLERLKSSKGEANENSMLPMADALGATGNDFDDVFSVYKALDHWRAQRVFAYLLRLPGAAAMMAAATRLGAGPTNESEARKWLAATGWDGVPAVETILETSYFDKAEAAKMLALVESPEIAAKMLSLRKYGSSKTIARGWLERLPAHAIDGLAPLLVKTAKEATPAVEYLRELKRKGLGWLIEKRAEHMEPAVARAVKEKVLDFDPTRLKKVTPADSGLAAILPPVKVRNDAGQLRRLTQPQMAKVIADLRTTPLGEPSPTLDLLKQNAERASVDTFVWGLFSDWLEGGAPSKDRWKFEALGHLGGDSVALRLTPLVRIWPGESQHARATAGLDILRAIGTDTALMQIHGISEKVSFKGIKDRAKECLNEIADARGFTPAELADRIIPDGGLDERGSRVFDFGPRQFTFVLSPDLKPMVRDDSGKRLPDLPKPNTRDDEAKSSESVASWKLLKKQVAEIARSQAVRLEQAMVVGRRWTPADFETLFVSHPVMAHLVRRLIWSGYDAAGRSLVSFRVGEDNSYSGETDEPLELPESVASIGIVHPSHLSSDARASWGEVLADYEIVPPFVQLGRPTYALTDDERRERTLTRFNGSGALEAKVWVFGLENLGWGRGSALDGGCFSDHFKSFGAAGVTAVVSYEGEIWMGDPSEWGDATITGVFFLRDEREARSGWVEDSKALPLSSIDPVIVSEVLHDISRLVAKGKKTA